MQGEGMGQHAWAIKLGSGGICIPSCERHGIVGLGWKDVDPEILHQATRDDLWRHVAETYRAAGLRNATIGAYTGQLYRFARECEVGDYILYYDPPRKRVRICRVTSGPLYRDFDPSEDIDIWHFRRVEYPAPPIPLLDFYGGLKGMNRPGFPGGSVT
jgi:predicted Mrr-cat superfamily restriction endonuclease